MDKEDVAHIYNGYQFSSVHQSCPTHCDPMNCSTPGVLSNTNSQSSLKLTSIKLGMPSSHLILCRPLLLLPPIPPNIRDFSNESTLHMKWSKYWSFSFSVSPSNEHPGLISFRMDWLDLLAVQGTTHNIYVSVSSVAQLCLTLCYPVNQSTPGLPVQHQLPEFTQTHIHRGSDAIQTSHPLVPFSSCSQSFPAS